LKRENKNSIIKIVLIKIIILEIEKKKEMLLLKILKFNF
jgi:hypothetical protein